MGLPFEQSAVAKRAAFLNIWLSSAMTQSHEEGLLLPIFPIHGAHSEAKRQLDAGIAVDRRLGNSFAASKKQILLVTSSLGSAGGSSWSDHESTKVRVTPSCSS